MRSLPQWLPAGPGASPLPLLCPGLGGRARGPVPCLAGVPRACLCVLDCKGKWLTAPSLPLLPLLPLPVLSGAEEEDGVSGRGVRPPHPYPGAGSAPGANRPRPGPCSPAESRPLFSPVSFHLTPNAITEVE